MTPGPYHPDAWPRDLNLAQVPEYPLIAGDRGVPRDAWTWPTGTADAIPYHPANQLWPLQFTFLTILLALTVAVLVLGSHATRTRAV